MNTKVLTSSIFVVASLLMTGCGGDGDTDTDTSPTDTSTTDTGTITTTDTGTDTITGTHGSLDCTDFIYDVYNVPMVSGDQLDVSVDTVSAATTFDPVLFASLEEGPGFANYIKWEDDVFECSYSPEALFDEPNPTGYCPMLSLTAQGAGDFRLIVDVAQWPCAADIVEYYITVKVNGEHVAPELIWDNYLDDW